jgi:hypothetical protein
VLTATVGAQKLDVLTPIERNFAIDEPVQLAIDARHLLIFDRATEQNILFMN